MIICMEPSYSPEEIAQWLALSPEERLLEAEALWNEFLLKYPREWKPFWKSFNSFAEYHRWLEEQADPRLW